MLTNIMPRMEVLPTYIAPYLSSMTAGAQGVVDTVRGWMQPSTRDMARIKLPPNSARSRKHPFLTQSVPERFSQRILPHLRKTQTTAFELGAGSLIALSTTAKIAGFIALMVGGFLLLERYTENQMQKKRDDFFNDVGDFAHTEVMEYMETIRTYLEELEEDGSGSNKLPWYFVNIHAARLKFRKLEMQYHHPDFYKEVQATEKMLRKIYYDNVEKIKDGLHKDEPLSHWAGIFNFLHTPLSIGDEKLFGSSKRQELKSLLMQVAVKCVELLENDSYRQINRKLLISLVMALSNHKKTLKKSSPEHEKVSHLLQYLHDHIETRLDAIEKEILNSKNKLDLSLQQELHDFHVNLNNLGKRYFPKNLIERVNEVMAILQL